ncbi:hypothetical protein AAF712_007628 [Marasmius tenuissimus]|uniref:Uncharacterized protein n=1 Tax=Marasmius tenuissimus TaxID=585030 RepID=A0ABR2ZW79_9AGAR
MSGIGSFHTSALHLLENSAAAPTRITIVAFSASGTGVAIIKCAAGQPRSSTVSCSSPTPSTTPSYTTGAPAIPAAATVRSVVFAFLGSPGVDDAGTVAEVALHGSQGLPLSVLAGFTAERMISTFADVVGGHALGEVVEIDIENAERAALFSRV